MGNLIYSMNVSLDGFVETTNHSLDWATVDEELHTNEAHRAATPLELLFDLSFVVAVAQAANALHHALADGQIAYGLGMYFIVFFIVWWPWVNFTWFASAYDTDDVAYRLLTFVQIAGVLIVAAGVPRVSEDFDFTVTVTGYVIMRTALVALWLRAAREDPIGRRVALRFAVAIGLIQLIWWHGWRSVHRRRSSSTSGSASSSC